MKVVHRLTIFAPGGKDTALFREEAELPLADSIAKGDLVNPAHWPAGVDLGLLEVVAIEHHIYRLNDHFIHLREVSTRKHC